MLWAATYGMSTRYNRLRIHFNEAEKSQCINENGWMNVLSTFYTHTSLGDLHTMCAWFTGILAFLFAVGVYILFWILNRFGKTRKVYQAIN